MSIKASISAFLFLLHSLRSNYGRGIAVQAYEFVGSLVTIDGHLSYIV
jgi:hypothetical protein